MSSESRDTSYYSLVKIRDSSTPLGMTEKCPHERIVGRLCSDASFSGPASDTDALQLSRQRLLGVGKSIGGDGDNGGILLQFARNNFVQCRLECDDN